MLLGEPAFHHIRAVLGFPFLEQLVIAALGLDDFAVMRILVLLHLAGAVRGLFSCCWRSSATASLGIQDVDDVTQAETVFVQQVA